MAFYTGSVKVISSDGTGIFPIPATTGVDRGTALYNNGVQAYFAYPGSPSAAVGTGFEYRSILTHGFTGGGYKNSTPWRSVNKTWHANDITFYVGEQLSFAVAYADAAFSDYNGYVFGVTDSGLGAAAQTASINLHNGLSRNRRSNLSGGGIPGLYGNADGTVPYGYDGGNPSADGLTYGSTATNPSGDVYTASGVGGWSMHVARDQCASATNQIGQEGYITGGGSTSTNRLHYGTEIMYTTTDSGMSGVGSGAHGQTKGFFNCGGTKKSITYSNQTWATVTGTWGTDGYQRFLSTKKGWHYQGQGSNTASTYITKWSEVTLADVTTTINRGFAHGEDNNQMGQDWGYTLGGYDGSMNYKTFKMTYATDTITLLGGASRPKGHYGASSAVNMSASATVTASLMG